MLRPSLPAVGLSLLLLPCLAAPAPAQTAGKKYAVLVGITDYSHDSLPALKYTENDVEELATLLKGESGFSSVRVLTVTRGKKDARDTPTAANVTKALNELFSKPTRHDTVLIALAGHGVQLEVSDRTDLEKPSKSFSYFCPTDAHFRDVNYTTGKAPKLILMPELMKDLNGCGAGTKLILVDACRNELKADTATRSFSVGDINLSKGTAALFSCKPTERAWEAKKLGKAGHGVFFHFVLEGLRGKAANKKGDVRWSDLVEYVTEQVMEQVPKIIEGGASQTPHGAANFIGGSPVLVGKPSGDDAALFRQAMNLGLGRGVDMDVRKAEALFEKAAAKGHAPSRLALCWLADYHAGSIRRDRDKAVTPAHVESVKKAAEADDADLWMLVGRMYMLGQGVERDDDEALQWLRKAAAKDQPLAVNDLGWMYSLGRGVARDSERAVKQFEHAATLGSAQAMRNLGLAYANGNGVGQDIDEAFRWYEKAARLKHPLAQLNVARMYRAGTGVARDSKLAVTWCRSAADQGLADAQVLLGWMYENAEGVERDYAEAVKHYRAAADQGDAAGQYSLGRLHEQGLGVKQDDEAALALYRKSAAQGFKLAQAKLKKLGQE